jgi:hypothetical protein
MRGIPDPNNKHEMFQIQDGQRNHLSEQQTHKNDMLS